MKVALKHQKSKSNQILYTKYTLMYFLLFQGHSEKEDSLTKLNEQVHMKELELLEHKKLMENMSCQLSVKENECSDLQVKLSALSDSSAETKSELEKQLSELSQKCQQFSEKYESEEHVSKQIFEEKQKEIDKLETNLADVEKIVEEKENNIKEMEERVGSFEELIQSLQQEVRKQTTAVEHLQNEVTQGQIEKGQLEEEKESLQKNLEQTATKIVDLSNQLAFHEDNLSQFAHSLKLLSPHLHHIDFQNLNQVSEIIKDIIGTSEQEIYTLKQQLDNTNKNLKDSTEREVQELRDIYETKLTNQMEENQSLHSKISQMASHLEDTQQEYEIKLANQTEEKQLLQCQFSSQITEVQTILESKLTEQTERNDTLQNEVTELTSQLNEFEKLRADNSSLVQDISALNEERNIVINERDILITQSAELEQTLKQLSKEKESLEFNFQTLTQDYEDIKLSADKLTHEKEDLELSINTKCSDNEESMNILNDLTKQNQELELKVKELTLENQDLQYSVNSYKERLDISQLALETKESEREQMEMKLTQALSETNDLSFVKEENVKITTELERLKEMEEIYHTLTIQSAHAEKEKTEAQTKVVELESVINVLRKEIDDFDEQKREVEREMEEKYNQLKEEKDELQIEYSELKNKNNLVESEQDPIIQGGGDIGWGDAIEKVEVEPLRQSVPENGSDTLITEISMLKDNLSSSESKCEKMLIKLKAFKAKNQALQTEVDQIKDRLAKTNKSMESDNDSNTALIESLREHMEQKDLDLLNIKAEKEELLKVLEKEKVKCEKLHVQMMENEGKSKSHTEVMLQQIEMESLELTELKSENLKLSDDVKILTDENSKLSKTLTQAMKEKETSHVEMEILRSEIEMLEHNKLEIERQEKDNRSLCDELESECKSYREIVAKLKQALNHEKEENFHKIKQIQTEGGDVTDLKNKITELEMENAKLIAMKNRVSELEMEHEQIMEEMDGLREDLINERKDSKDKMDKLKVEIQNKDIENVNYLESEVEKLRSLCKQQKEEREGLDWKLQEVASLEEEIEELRLELEIARKEQKTVGSDESLKKLKDDLDHTKAALKMKESECENLKSNHSAESSSDRVTELEEQLELINEELNETMSENEKLKSNPSNMKAQMYETVQSKFEELAEKYSSALEENKRLEVELRENNTSNKTEKSKAENTVDDSRVRDLEEQLELINDELNELMSENEKLKKESVSNGMKIKMFDDLQEKFDDICKTYETLEKENSALKTQINDNSQQMAENSEVEGLKEQLDIINEELNELMSENERLRSRSSPQEMKVKMFDSLQKEFQEMGEKYSEAVKNVNNLKLELERKNIDIESLRGDMLEKNTTLIDENMKREEVHPVGNSVDVTSKESEYLKNENEKLRQLFEDKNLMLDKLQKDFNNINSEYNKIINDNSSMAKQIEELHQRLLQQGESQKDISFIKEERDHFEREKERLIKHILELEKQLEAQSDQNIQVNQELLRVESELQQLVFDNNSMRSQLNLSSNDGKQTSRFQADYEQLQKQFNVAMGQKNQSQAENNQLNHRLQQRETRCQQLARQVNLFII